MPTGNPRHKAENEPTKASRTACAHTGQGTMSLAGAGRSPRNYCRQAILAARRNPNPHKSKPDGLRLYGSRDDVPCGCRAEPAELLPTGNPRHKAENEPTKASRTACAHTGQGTMSLAGAGQRPRNYCRKASGAAASELRKASRPACAIADRQPPPQGGNRTHKSKPRLALLPPSGGHSPPLTPCKKIFPEIFIFSQ